MNGPLLINLLPPEQIAEAAKAPPDQALPDRKGRSGRRAGPVPAPSSKPAGCHLRISSRVASRNDSIR